MKRPGGTIANETGTILETFIKEVLKRRGYVFVEKNRFLAARVLNQPIYTRKLNICKSIYGTKIECDFILFHHAEGETTSGKGKTYATPETKLRRAVFRAARRRPGAGGRRVSVGSRGRGRGPTETRRGVRPCYVLRPRSRASKRALAASHSRVASSRKRWMSLRRR